MKLKQSIKKFESPLFLFKIFINFVGAVVAIAFILISLNAYYEGILNWFYQPATAEVNPQSINKRPEIKHYEVVKEYYTTVTAYNAGDPAQCDSTPCISANGENICTAIAKGYKRCASNDYPFGTRLYVEGYGECLVVDRMRDDGVIDVAMPADQYKEAVAFGAKKRLVKVLK